MSSITIDEQNKKRIQKYLRQAVTMYGYEEDIALLEENGQLTEELARKIFTEIMKDTDSIRTIGLNEKVDGEFKELIEVTFAKYDSIPKPEQYEQYGIYDGAYRNMDFQDIYSNMQIAFEMKELDSLYYGCKDLRDIANTAISSIDGIEKYNIDLPEETKEALKEIQEELRQLLSEDKTNIKAIQEKVNSYNEYATGIWNDYLTSIEDSQNEKFRWVIHNLNKGELEGDFRDKYMSTSLMTDKAMGVYGRSNYGLIIKPKHFVSASYKDTYTYNTRDENDELFMIRRPPLMLPQEIEDICIRQTIEANGEMLNYSQASIYSEMVIDEYEIQGVYYISNGEQELAKDYERAKKVAEERGLPLEERDISKYREQLGLEPITETNQRILFRNILQKSYKGNEELISKYYRYEEEFITRNYKEFYERYMTIKHQEKFSVDDIWKIFIDIARKDMNFNWIAQEYDERHMTTEEIETLRIMREYGLEGIADSANLQRRLEHIISDGIRYSASQSEDGDKKFAEIKQVLPQFESFKEVYLQLRQYGIEDKLYENLDFKNISYDRLLKRAEAIIAEQLQGQEQEEIDQTKKEQLSEENGQTEDAIGENDNRINEYGEIIRDNTGISTESQIPDEQVSGTEKGKKIEAPQPEKSKQKGEGIQDDIVQGSVQIQARENEKVQLWMNRFESWYNAIDRVAQNVKAKFVKMKSDIVNAISDKLKERTNKRQQNVQAKASNER